MLPKVHLNVLAPFRYRVPIDSVIYPGVEHSARNTASAYGLESIQNGMISIAPLTDIVITE